MKKEIKILGAGISGLSSAIILSKNGFKVKIFERENKIGKRNNHISAIRNYEKEDVSEQIKSFGIKIKPTKKINLVIRYSPSGFISKTVSTRPIFYMFERGEFFENSIEKQLYKQAKENDVKIIYKRTVKDADIIAIGPKRTDIYGYGKIYEGKINNVILFYNNDYAPKGYICVLPSVNKFEILAVSFDKNEFNNLKNRFNKAIKENEILKKMVKKFKLIRNVEGIANYFSPVGYKNNKYYVGEAGGFQDPSRGFGLWYAILTGYLAAKSIIEKIDYNELWKKKLLKELKENTKRREIFNRLNNKDLDVLIKKMGEEITLKKYKKKRKF